MIIEHIKFYANTPAGDKNKLFTFECTLINLQSCLERFMKKGFNIRACWYQNYNDATGEIINKRIPTKTLQDIFDGLF